MGIQYDNNGLIIQNLSEILDEREENCRTFLGDDFQISGESVCANLQASDGDRELSIQELLLYLATQLDPEQAEGIWLDYICSLNNIQRISATKTIIPITVTGTPGTSKNAGDITIADDQTDEYFINKDAFLISNDGTVLVEFQATSFGEVVSSSSHTFTIKTPTLGVEEIEWSEDGEQQIGRNTETDDELKARRLEAVTLTATSVLSSIKANVEQVSGVVQVNAYENDTLTTSDGIPAKAFEIVVRGGDDQEIAQAIFLKKPAGIQAYGTTTKYITDEDTNVFTIGFTRPTLVPIDLKIQFTASETVTDELKTKIKDDLIKRFNSLYNIGSEVYVYNLYCTLSKYTEITNVSLFQAKRHEDEDEDYSDNVEIGKRELATLSASNITLTQL